MPSAQPLKILVCGGDLLALQRIAQSLLADGVKVKTTTRVIDYLCFSQQEWDILLIDLDGMTSFLKSLLPAIRRRFTQLYMIGVSCRPFPEVDLACYGLKLDDYLCSPLSPEDLIVRLPSLATSYLCDTGTLRSFGSQPLTGPSTS